MQNTTAARISSDHTIKLRRLPHNPKLDKPQTYHLTI